MVGQGIADGDFKSPKHKLLSFFHVARDKWRERAREYHRALRSQGITLRDLRHSRDEWKRKYQHERVRRLDLERQLGRGGRESKEPPD